MAETVRVTVQTGPHKGRRFCFRGPAQCLVGRVPECFMRFVGADRDLCISRRHCQLTIDPPVVHLHDLGSLNGTYVNGRAIAPTAAAIESPALTDAGSPICNVHGGDIITIGGTSLVVDIVDCPPAAPNADHAPVWTEGEVAKDDCPIPCV